MSQKSQQRRAAAIRRMETQHMMTMSEVHLVLAAVVLKHGSDFLEPDGTTTVRRTHLSLELLARAQDQEVVYFGVGKPGEFDIGVKPRDPKDPYRGLDASPLLTQHEPPAAS